MKQVFNNFTKCGVFFVLFLLLSDIASAQRTIKGKVTDATNGEGLIGATVSVVGTPRGSVTDLDGNYSVDVPNGATQLRFSYTGFTEQTVALTSSNMVDVALASGTALDEVVVVGYGTLKSREVTSSVARLTSAEFNKGNIVDATQMLQGKVAGLTISRPGGDPNGTASIRLRGLTTFGANIQPLIVIDGVPGQSLSSIDPNDIETIDVLKDGSAAAIYGTRGSSGVILITTKKGKAGTSSVEYTGQVSANTIAKKVESMGSTQYLAEVPNAKNLGSSTNWLDQITQTGIAQTHTLGMSGGTNKTTYRATIGFRNTEGIAVNTGFKQYNGTVSLSQVALGDRLKLQSNIGVYNRNADVGFAEAFRYAAVYNPTAPIKNADGSYFEIGGFEQFNPVAMVNQNTNQKNSNNYFGNLKADLTIRDGLVFSTLVNRSNEYNKAAEFYSRKALYRSGNQGLARAEEFNGRNDLLESTLNYGHEFGKFDFKALAGYSWQEFTSSGWVNSAKNVGVDNFGIDNFAAYASWKDGTGTSEATSYKNDYKLIAQFGRVNFGYDDTYFMTASLRREGCSRFGADNKWGLFPAVSAGVDLTKLTQIGNFNNLKLRAGYGVTGAIPGESYLSLAKVSPTGNSGYIGGAYVPAWGFSGTNPNSDLKWEKKASFNIGLDFGLSDSKLSGSVEYYTQTVSDLIYEVPAANPPNLGLTTWANAGKLKNGGVELALTYAVTKNWSSTFAGTIFTPTKLLEFYENFSSLAVAPVGAPGQNNNYYQVVSGLDGYNTIGNFIALDVARLGADGKYIYRDFLGAETTDKLAARTVIAGNGLPKYELGWTNSFTFGNFDAQLFIRGMFGHSLANEFRAFYETLGDNNGFNKVVTKYYDAKNLDNNSFTNRTVEKAGFVRFDNLSLGYSVPIAKDALFTRARIFVNGQNLGTITNYSGVDPIARFVDTGNVDNGGRATTSPSPLAPGSDRRNTYFTARTFTLGVTLGF